MSVDPYALADGCAHYEYNYIFAICAVNAAACKMAMSSEQLIANEVLAFLQHAIDTMDEVSIIKICTSNFTCEEIGEAKKLLFESLGQIDRMPSRRRDEKGEKGLQDTINILKVTDPDDVPTFVARNLNKLPPVTFDHVDVTRLLKDITTLKASMAEVVLKLEVSQNTIDDLRTEVATLRKGSVVCRSPEANNINMRRGAGNCSTASFESAKFESSPVAIPERVSSDVCVARPPPPPAEVSSVVTSPQRDYAAAAARQQPEKRTKKRIERDSGNIRIEPPRSALPKGTDNDGFTKVERRKKKPLCRNQCGTALTGSSHLLRPAVPVTHVYVSRLHYTTKASDVMEYMAIKTKLRMSVEKLETRNAVNFTSFVVRVPTEHLAIILKEELWPKGVVFRKFRGRRPHPEATRPAFHVAAKT